MKKLSYCSRESLARSLPLGEPKILKRLGAAALTLAVSEVSTVHADATLTYEMSAPGVDKTVKQISLARFFARIDDPAEPERYLVFQAGKFFPLYSVSKADQTYTLLTPTVTPRLGPVSSSEQEAQASTAQTGDRDDRGMEGGDNRPPDSAAQAGAENNPQTEPASSIPQTAAADSGKPVQPETASAEAASQADPDGAGSGAPEGKASGSETSDVPTPRSARRTEAAKLKPTKKTRSVADVECRVVHELVDGEPVIEHCMANSARLGVTDRELITLSRVFGMSRNMEYGWLGVGTKDEEFVSVQSRDLRSNRTLQLTSISTKPLAAGYLRIPNTFKQVKLDTKRK